MDKYHILHPIGEGAFGKVFKGRRKHSGQIVALKFITIRQYIQPRGKTDKELVNLRQEIEILKRLKHENIIRLLDSFETQHEFCVVTEIAQGEVFEILEDDKSLGVQEVRKIAQQLVHSLFYLHSNRIIHRDMKPQNILIGANGVIKLCDFGFARSMSNNTQVLTSIKGTPLYMSPELVKEEPYDHSADLWSLGVIIYELFIGQPPFYTNSIYTLIKMIVNDEVQYPDSIQGDFKDFLQRLLTKERADRIGWPALLHHPFIKETDQEKKDRKVRIETYNQWTHLQHMPKGVKETIPQIQYEVQKRDLSPNRKDNIWGRYEQQAQDEKSVFFLRQDAGLLDQLLGLLQMQVGDIVGQKDKNNILSSLRTICIMASKTFDQPGKIDILKNEKIPLCLTNLLKQFYKPEFFGKSQEIICEIVKSLGLLQQISFNQQVGLDNPHLKQFLPLLSKIMNSGMKQQDQFSHMLFCNIIKTFEIIQNQSSYNPLRYNFKKIDYYLQ